MPKLPDAVVVLIVDDLEVAAILPMLPDPLAVRVVDDCTCDVREPAKHSMAAD